MSYFDNYIYIYNNNNNYYIQNNIEYNIFSIIYII